MTILARDHRAETETDFILEMRGITKSFPGAKALNDVNLQVRRGEIHAIVGENGAGKSTLMKVLSGVYPSGTFDGAIVFEGEQRRFSAIPDSEKLGIIIIHQELALVPQLSISENIFLGNEPQRFGIVDAHAATVRTRRLLRLVGLDENPATPVGTLGIGKQQLVEIAKALSKEVRLLILDEPTASLNESDSDALLQKLLEFKVQGISSILISHKLNEIAKVADSITVLRDGATIETLDARSAPISEDRIIKGMVGRALSERYPLRNAAIGEILFEIRDWSAWHPLDPRRRILNGVSLSVRRGEVVGLAGLMGAGRTELAMSVFGRSYGQKITGEVRLNGRPVDVSTVRKAIDAGLAYVTEDRKRLGLLLDSSITHNVTLANLAGVSRAGVIDEMREIVVANDYRRKLQIRSSSVAQDAAHLSGGNQQKIVLGKWLFSEPDLLILDEPTRGVDVGAKYEIYAIINELAEAGKGVLVISSEMPELLGICDRIYVLNEGRIVGEMPAKDADQEKIMQTIMQGGEQAS